MKISPIAGVRQLFPGQTQDGDPFLPFELSEESRLGQEETPFTPLASASVFFLLREGETSSSQALVEGRPETEGGIEGATLFLTAERQTTTEEENNRSGPRHDVFELLEGRAGVSISSKLPT